MALISSTQRCHITSWQWKPEGQAPVCADMTSWPALISGSGRWGDGLHAESAGVAYTNEARAANAHDICLDRRQQSGRERCASTEDQTCLSVSSISPACRRDHAIVLAMSFLISAYSLDVRLYSAVPPSLPGILQVADRIDVIEPPAAATVRCAL